MFPHFLSTMIGVSDPGLNSKNITSLTQVLFEVYHIWFRTQQKKNNLTFNLSFGIKN